MWSNATTALAALDAGALMPISVFVAISSWPKKISPAAIQVYGRSACAAGSPIGSSRHVDWPRSRSAPPSDDTNAQNHVIPTKSAPNRLQAGDTSPAQRSEATIAQAARPGSAVPITTNHSA